MENPELCVVKGTGKAIEYLDGMPEGIVDLSKVKAKHRMQSGATRR